MEERKFYILYGNVWNPNRGEEGEYELKQIKRYNTLKGAKMALARCECTSDVLTYEIVECVENNSVCEGYEETARVAFKDEYETDFERWDYNRDYYEYV